MTYGEMYSLFNTLLDKGGYPYLAEVNFDMLANERQNVLMNSLIMDYQKTQVLSDKISPLVTNFSLTNKTQIIPSTDLSGYWHLGSMEGYSQYMCGSKLKKEYYPIVPLEGMSVVTNDPFNRPSERNLYYVESNDLLALLPDTGLDVSGWYFKQPNKINSNSTPNVVSQFKDDVCEEIVRMTEAIYSLTLGDMNGMQGTMAINTQSRLGYDGK